MVQIAGLGDYMARQKQLSEQAKALGLTGSDLTGSDLSRRVGFAQQFQDTGRDQFINEILSGAGITADQLTPELQAQLDKLVGLAEQGRSFQYGDMLKGFQATAPVVAAQERRFAPYEQAGLSALDQQMALLGLRGDDAMRAAYMENPAQEFAREQAEKAMIRNRAVTGGLGDEGVQRELAYLTSGLTNQNIQQQLQQLGLLSGRGMESSFAGAEAAAGGIADAGAIARMSDEQRAIRNAQNSGFNKVLGGLGMVSSAINLGSSIIPAIGSGYDFLKGLGSSPTPQETLYRAPTV